ncbi:MAG TPA: lysophospholipid acyltransferase family protein [Acidimicrobiales bacterium]|nr:lysophospholipid acyltransferase family protein [Acidimicrobiales bacterium]
MPRAVRRPNWPGGIEPRPPERRTGVDYETAWARRYPVRLVRAAMTDSLTLPLAKVICSPVIEGLEHLDVLEGPAIFTANHASHLDTGLLISCLPARIRHRTVVAAAADYFFDERWKGAFWAFALNSIPMERVKVNRRSANLAADLIDEGWNLVIFPEGGRSPDGWGQEFKGGAAYLAKRCGVPVVPMHMAGTRAILAKGSGRFRPGTTQVRYGRPLWPGLTPSGMEEDARHFSARLEQAVALLADEAETDWWSARRRAASGSTPALRGPDVSPWRRAWSLPESAGGRPDREAGRSPSWPFKK